jgi:hypothetical protein
MKKKGKTGARDLAETYEPAPHERAAMEAHFDRKKATPGACWAEPPIMEEPSQPVPRYWDKRLPPRERQGNRRESLGNLRESKAGALLRGRKSPRP